MDRRTFIRGAAAAATLPGVAPTVLSAGGLRDLPGSASSASTVPDPRALIIDAMGELRPIYEPSLVHG